MESLQREREQTPRFGVPKLGPLTGKVPILHRNQASPIPIPEADCHPGVRRLDTALHTFEIPALKQQQPSLSELQTVVCYTSRGKKCEVFG